MNHTLDTFAKWQQKDAVEKKMLKENKENIYYGILNEKTRYLEVANILIIYSVSCTLIGNCFI